MVRGQIQIKELLSKFNMKIGSELVFGEPIIENNITIIPVAKVKYGFGFGRGASAELPTQGEGGGGGVVAKPIGYIEIKEGKSEFKKIPPTSNLLATLATAIIAGILISRML